MKILHPNNKEYLPLEELKDYYEDGFYDIISKREKKTLEYFLTSFEDYRENHINRISDKNTYPNLPFSGNSPEWKERQKDVKIIDKLIKHKQKLIILDIGSWNGWLSNYYAKKGHYSVAVNMFRDEFDGLKATKNYNTNFTSLQLMADEIYRIEYSFDIIIFNRNWAYFNNQQKIFEDAQQLLKDGGNIIFTGLPFYQNTKQVKKNLTTANISFENKYKIPLLYNQSKGFLSYFDKQFFKKNNISLNSYSLFRNWIKIIFPKKMKLFYGTYIHLK